MRTLPSLLLLPFLAAGCGGAAVEADRQPWADALSANSCKGYGAFLKEHPESAKAADARSRQSAACDREEWEQAKSANTQGLYLAYLQNHKDGAHAAEARKVLAQRAVKRVGLEISSLNCSEDSCPFLAVCKKVLQNAGIQVADRSEGNDVVVKIAASIAQHDAGRGENLPYSTFEGSISVQAGGSTAMSREFKGRATGDWEVYGVHQTPRWPTPTTVFNSAPFEETMAAVVRDFFGR